MNNEYAPGDPQTVLVTGRIIEESLCEGACIFTYLEAGTIHLKPLSATDFLADSFVTIQSQNNADITGATVNVGTKSAIIMVTIGVDTIIFKYPSLPAGSYDIVVTVDGNNAYRALTTTTSLVSGDISSTSGSNKGQILNVNGNGFTTKESPSNQIEYICSGISKYLSIITMIPTKVTF